MAKEVLKVLKPNGLFLVDAVHGRDQGINPGFFESFFWKSIDELVRVLEHAGFLVSRRTTIAHPWPGEQICFRRPFA
jgi:predicted RNA binding protein YcfA (HicA-like mRNA interferase family)